MSKLAEKEVQLLKERLDGKRIFLIVDESEINRPKYLNILVGETAVPENKLYIELQCCRARQPASCVGKNSRRFNEAGCWEGEFYPHFYDCASSWIFNQSLKVFKFSSFLLHILFSGLTVFLML